MDARSTPLLHALNALRALRAPVGRRLGRGGSRLAALALLAALAACGRPAGDPSLDGARRPPTAEVAELEIRAQGSDRFTRCPPPGELGQHWIPTPPPWTAPAASAPASAPPPVDEDYVTRTKDYTTTEQAIEATHRDLRSCYRKGLVHAPTQDGRVGLVLRIGPDGKVARVESYAACELAPESLACMEGVVGRLRFPPPAGGADTLVIPAVFTSRDGVRYTTPTNDDAYTASAYLTIDGARPALHACERQARRDQRPMHATGTFTLALRADGTVARAHVDPWAGEQSLLLCAAKALEQLRFPPPPPLDGRAGDAGIASEASKATATVIARVNFNPRQVGR